MSECSAEEAYKFSDVSTHMISMRPGKDLKLWLQYSIKVRYLNHLNNLQMSRKFGIWHSLTKNSQPNFLVINTRNNI